METISEIFSKEALCQRHSESSWFPHISTSCTTQCKEKQKYINKHITRRQGCSDGCSHAGKDFFLGSHENVQDKSFFQMTYL